MLTPAELYLYFVEFKDFWPGPGVKWLWTNHHVTLKVFNVYCLVIFSVRIWPDKNNDSTTGPVPAPKPNKREMKSYFLPPQASFVGGNISIRCQRTFWQCRFKSLDQVLVKLQILETDEKLTFPKKNAKNTGLESFVKKQSAFFLGFHHWGWKYWFLKTSNFGNKKHYCFLFNGHNDVIIHIGKMVTKRIQWEWRLLLENTRWVRILFLLKKCFWLKKSEMQRKAKSQTLKQQLQENKSSKCNSWLQQKHCWLLRCLLEWFL